MRIQPECTRENSDEKTLRETVRESDRRLDSWTKACLVMIVSIVYRTRDRVEVRFCGRVRACDWVTAV